MQNYEKLIRNGRNKEDAFNKLVLGGKISILEREISKIMNDKSIPRDEKTKMIQKLKLKRQALLAERRG
ncbi:hypothetical protein [Desulfofarcimen acetoxidans]|uniref:hypothetical protein n=1 Tax=Desulfofarcimen acetoxidans TaxID=58138 RepID=UPI00019E6303|nr:hypothetical protein [Desulfofarcimen acetoxidans]